MFIKPGNEHEPLHQKDVQLTAQKTEKMLQTL